MTLEQFRKLVGSYIQGKNQLENMYNDLTNCPKLQKQDKIIWVNALKSGKYKQGKGALKYRREPTPWSPHIGRDDECDKFFYCCLGVYVEEINVKSNLAVYREETIAFEFMNLGIESFPLYEKFFGSYVPDRILPRMTQKLLARLNDAYVPFNVLATIIEEML